MNIINLAQDPGFGGFKTCFINGHGPQTGVLPAVVGAGALKGVHLSTGLSRGRGREKPRSVRLDDGALYLVGHNVHRHTRPVERLDFQRLSDGPELKALMYASLWQALGGGNHAVNLLLGLPVEVLQDKSLAASTRAHLRAWLVGEHRFSVDGQTTGIAINQVKTLAQPLGAFFNWGMDCAGQWTQTDDPGAKFAVADIGFNTVDLFVIEEAQVHERYSGGDTLGMRRACSFLRSTLKERHGVDLSLYQADALLQAKNPVFHHAGGSESLTTLAAQALDNVFGGIAAFLEDMWGNARQFRRVILTGGGADALRDRLLTLYPHAVIMPEAQLANAVGLAKFAQRPAVFK